MQKITYVGPSRAGIWLPKDAAFVHHGETVEVDDKLARELLGRNDNDGKPEWRKVASGKPPAAKKPSAKTAAPSSATPEPPVEPDANKEP